MPSLSGARAPGRARTATRRAVCSPEWQVVSISAHVEHQASGSASYSLPTTRYSLLTDHRVQLGKGILTASPSSHVSAVSPKTPKATWGA
eukprot:scaffold66510_cov87-Phaeocystis_antarctica.AAC.1